MSISQSNLTSTTESSRQALAARWLPSCSCFVSAPFTYFCQHRRVLFRHTSTVLPLRSSHLSPHPTTRQPAASSCLLPL
jgi:hypothetical protein